MSTQQTGEIQINGTGCSEACFHKVFILIKSTNKEFKKQPGGKTKQPTIDTEAMSV